MKKFFSSREPDFHGRWFFSNNLWSRFDFDDLHRASFPFFPIEFCPNPKTGKTPRMRGGEKFHIPAVKGKQPLRRGATPMPPQEPKLPTVEVVVVEPSTVEPSRVGDSAESPSTSARPAMAGVSESANEKELRSGTGWTTFIRLVISAIRQQAIPGIILICFEFLLLALYYWVPNTKVAYDWIAATKVKWGFGYVALSSSVFCGIVRRHHSPFFPCSFASQAFLFPFLPKKRRFLGRTSSSPGRSVVKG